MNSIGQTVFEIESGNENVDGQMDGQTNRQKNRQNYTNLKRNLAIMVMYVPVKFEFDWRNCFRVRLWKRKCGQRDEQTDKKRTNKQMELHQSRKEPSYNSDVCPCQV